MSTNGPDSDDWSQIVAALGGPDALAQSALRDKAFTFARGVRSAEDLLRLALSYGPGGHSLRMVCALAGTSDFAQLTDAALTYRLSDSCHWLEALCAEALERLVPPRASSASRTIRLIDGSIIKGPGNRQWRLHMGYDLGRRRMVGAAITSTQIGERLDCFPAESGEIRIGDRCYPSRDGFANVMAGGADVLVRLTWKSLRLTDPQGDLLDWSEVFRQTKTQGHFDQPVHVVRPRGNDAAVPMRLVVLPKPTDAAASARRTAQRAASRAQTKTRDPRTDVAADHLILITTLDPTQFSADDLMHLYRLRWQVELVFKRMKSILKIDRLPAKSEPLAKTWLHAHLLFAILIEHFAAEAGAFSP
jgi:DDE family transposase